MDKDIKFTLEGLLAQITAHMVLHTQAAPLERVKILLQTQNELPGLKISDKYTGVRDCMRRVRREEGSICFWRGNLAGIYRESLRFTTTFTLSSIFLSKGSTRTLNALVDIIAMYISYPWHVARVRLGADVEGEFGGIEECLRAIFNKDGFTGVFMGSGLSVVHSLVKTVSMTYLNRFMEYLVDKITKDESLRLLLKYVLRPMANVAALTIAYPLDLIKNVLIMQVGRADATLMTPGEAFVSVISSEGVKGLYKGIVAEILVTLMASLPFEELEGSLRAQIWRLLRKYF